ncbi:hypothetical protein, partial [Brachyspira catarrhinii]|uniref:hypothetical protein n=1 Tax=Brachyspira catarrhinii TaxID=2528966 RepID=UPI001F465C0F
CQNAKESRLNKIRFYNLAYLLSGLLHWQHARFSAVRNDNFNYVHTFSYALKNNFVILNLVKSFLASITFDSLSRRIKNPCLVINILFIGGIQ